MNSSSRYKQQADSLRRKQRTNTPPKKVIRFSELVERKDIPPGTYQINENTNILSPKTLPKTGDLVLIEPGPCPKEMATNIVYVKDLSDKAFIYDAWVPTYKFFLLQMVIFWKNGTQYEFQIQYSDSDNPKIGKFVLTDKKKTAQMPGGAYRVPQKTRI